MAKKGQTAKHRKQRKKEKANKKENKQQRVAQQAGQKIPSNSELPEPAPGAIEKIAEATKPLSPARRAFQDV